MGTLKHYAIRNEFKKRGSPYIHSFTYTCNTRNIQNEAACIDFIEKTTNAQLSNHLNDSKLLELVNTYQGHGHSSTCWKYNKNECLLSYDQYFTEKTIIVKPLCSKFNNDEKREVLGWRIPC